MQTVFIYALKDPITEEIRYIGKTAFPEGRINEHVRDSKRKGTHRAHWVQSLVRLGLRPVLEIVDEVLETEWQAAECAYIEFYRGAGHNLVNSTAGGEGVELTPEIRAKMSLAQLGNKKGKGRPIGSVVTAETRAKISAFQKGRPKSAETCAKISAGNKGKVRSAETRAKISATLKGRPVSEGTHAKLIRIGLARRGTKYSPEHCAAISAGKMGKKYKPRKQIQTLWQN